MKKKRREPKIDNTIICIFGRKGSGKSTLAKEIVADYDRVAILDSQGEYGKPEKAKIYWGRDDSIHAIMDAEKRKKFRISLRIVSKEESLEILDLLFELEDYLLVLEETSLYCSPHVLPDELARIIRYGRHKRISQIYIARRPSEINREITANADLIITFQQKEPRDLEYLRAVGFNEDEVRNLPQYHFVWQGEKDKLPFSVIERLSLTQRQS